MPCRRAAAGDLTGRRDSACSMRRPIARVREEARPDPRDADELHDALMTCGLLDGRASWRRSIRRGCARSPRPAAPTLVDCRRDDQVRTARRGRGGAAARVAGAFIPASRPIRAIAVPRRERRATWTRDGGDHRARAGPADDRRPDHRGRRWRRTWASRARTSTRRCWRSNPKASCCAVVHAPVLRVADGDAGGRRSNGATARCSRASIATRSTACAPRSSRSRPPTSCGSCSSGSTSTRRPG